MHFSPSRDRRKTRMMQLHAERVTRGTLRIFHTGERFQVTGPGECRGIEMYLFFFFITCNG